MKKILFVTSFRNLTISGQLQEPFELLPGINITNNPRIKSKILSRNLFRIIGQIEYDHLTQQESIVFCEFDEQELHELDTAQFLLVLLLWIKNLFRTAWILKDHCMECDAAYLIKDWSQKDREYSNNFLAQRTLLANGEIEPIMFSIEELNNWRDLNHKIEERLHAENSGEFDFFMEKEYLRSARALHFIHSATTSRNLAFRIAHYCSALETLFSTDAAELSHKLSERTAFFLGSFGHDKAKVFKEIKAAYGVRSKLTHGDSINKKTIEQLPHISKTLDEYLRQIFAILYGADWAVEHIDSAPKKIDHIFAEMIFNGKTFIEAANEYQSS
ncbi:MULTISPECIES: HEPN domain-containing protein [Methylomonas]|uniref:Uncharacterized protein n=2 Tax=Methylomonas TaxID=416 RepID=A0A140E759_9GAMM|nr:MULTISPECIES: HEPN domain-containing protein [Methylomonas]AMK79233.1 hypothetical protein JT25_022565 [Methylomonas denitrificans]OAH98139.1 hypothetical protein A1342_00255 [Methylomonas methanica]TCV86248.1 hypothetical protein EDE11_104192 [Methylomonas methanica]